MLSQKEMILLISLMMLLGGGGSSTQRRNAQKEEAPIPILTVCEALSHASEYDGKMVRIRGKVGSTDEGVWFLGEDCPGVYVTDGKAWPSTIAWTMPTDLMFILHRVDFSYDRASDKPVSKKYRRLRKRVPDTCIEFEYTGMLESWSKAKARKTDPKGHVYEIAGFGHLNGAPAQLVLKSADDATPIPNCNGKK